MRAKLFNLLQYEERQTMQMQIMQESGRCEDGLYGFLGGSVGKEFAYNAGDLDSIPGLGRSPGREQLPTPVFWPGEFHGLSSPWSHKESTTEGLSLSEAR